MAGVDAGDVAEAFVRGYLVRQDAQQADQMLTAWSTLHPQAVDVKFYRGLASRLRGDSDRAREAFQSVLADCPQHELAREGLAELLLERRLPRDAWPHYRQVLRENPASIPARVGAAQSLRKLGLWTAAEAVLQDMLSRLHPAPEVLQEAAAAKAFENAERLAPENSLASFYLGQTLVLLGQSDKAIEAFERAIARQPARTDLLEMFQTLGRVHQRTAHNDKALDVWNRLEQQFPNDERVQEQIATTLLEEEAFDAALPRFEKLAHSVKDRGRQLAFRMEAADIRVRLGQTEAALKEFETLLGQLNPDHWIYRDVRRRIEAIHMRTEDRAGLATYYEARLAQHPDDLDAIVRVAKVYTALGRDEIASEWLERGVKLADAALAAASQQSDTKFAEAITAERAELAKAKE